MVFLNEIHLSRKLLFIKTRLLFSICLLFCLVDPLQANDTIPDVLVKLQIQKVYVENLNYLAVNFKNEPHWHTYWKNPGDAGLPIKISFENNKDIITPMEWPGPKRYIEPGNAWAYGHENEYSLFFKLNNSIPTNIISAGLFVNIFVFLARLKYLSILRTKQYLYPLENSYYLMCPMTKLFIDLTLSPKLIKTFLKTLILF